MSSKPLRFVTLPISHYCEKSAGRWNAKASPSSRKATARCCTLFDHAAHGGNRARCRSRRRKSVAAPGSDRFHRLSAPLADHYGASWLYAHPEAAALEDELDDKLGPATRRFAYFTFCQSVRPRTC